MEEKKTKAKVTKPRVKGLHLTTAQKAEAVSLWKAGDVTLEQLSLKFGKDRSTFIRLFNGLGVAKGEAAEERAKKVAEEVEKSTVEDASEIAKRIRETKDNSYKLAKAIERLISAQIVDAQQKKLPISSKINEFKSLELAAKGLRLTREERYAVLGITNGEKEDEDDIPDLEVRELTETDVREIQAKAMIEGNKDPDLDIPDVDIATIEDGEAS